jgi:hypothetical protein
LKQYQVGLKKLVSESTKKVTLYNDVQLQWKKNRRTEEPKKSGRVHEDEVEMKYADLEHGLLMYGMEFQWMMKFKKIWSSLCSLSVSLWMLRTTRKWIVLHTAKDFELVLKGHKNVISTVLLLARDL